MTTTATMQVPPRAYEPEYQSAAGVSSSRSSQEDQGATSSISLAWRPSPLQDVPPQAEAGAAGVPAQITDSVQRVDMSTPASPGTLGNRTSSHGAAMNATSWSTIDVEQQPNKRLRRFYAKQNDLVKRMQVYHTLPSGDDEHTADTKQAWSSAVSFAVKGSFALNVLLFVLKLIAAIQSGSMTVIASAADSLLDLMSGLVLSVTQWAMNKKDPSRYPQGKTRMEPIGVIVFAVVMGLSSLQIIIEATKRLFDKDPSFDLDRWTLMLLAGTVVSKLVAFVLCRFVASHSKSSSVEAYAADHRNDVITNTVGIAAVVLAFYINKVWFLDPVGAIVIAIMIMVSWYKTGCEHAVLLTGRTAPPEFLKELTYVACHHDPRIIAVDTVRAYHFGVNFLVEVDIVLPPSMPLRESHDIGESLQICLEELEEVERAFVHNDFEWSHSPEHKKV